MARARRRSAPAKRPDPRDVLDGIVFVLDYFGVRAIPFHDDADGDSGVHVVGHHGAFVITEPAVLRSYTLAARWAQVVATRVRGVLA